MVRTILIDDEEIALDLLEILLLKIGGVSVIGKFQQVSEAIERAPELQPDLIFLDIEMPGMNGLVAGELLMARCPDAELIFVTAYHQYAIEAFEVNAIGYLLKPVVKEKLAKVLERYNSMRAKIARQAIAEPAAPQAAAANGDGAEDQADVQKQLRLKVLGGLELYDPQGQLVTWRTKKTKELFAYLWSHGGDPVYRYHMLDHLWPNTHGDRAQTLFHTTLYNLRHMLRTAGFPDMVAFGDERYWMRTEHIRSDSDRLQAIMQGEGGLADADELLSLYKGDCMETEHYEWAGSIRIEIRSAYSRHLLRLSEEASGSVKERILWKLVELDPYEEEGYNRLLQHLSEGGNMAAISKLIELKKVLERELKGPD